MVHPLHAGALFVVLAGLLPAQTVIFEKVGGSDFPLMGMAVAGAGDVNADGVPDFAAAGPVEVVPGTWAARVRVWSGAGGALLWETTTGGFGAQNVRVSLIRIDDATGAGTGDLALGFVDDFSQATWPGRVLILDGTNGNPSLTVPSALLADAFGYALASAGDLDGDGLGDLAVGPPRYAIEVGRVYLLSGATGLPLLLPIAPPAFTYRFGSALAFCGDHDLDGRADLAVGAPQGNHALLVSSGTGIALSALGPCTSYAGPGAVVGYGSGLACPGDLNGDGMPEVAVLNRSSSLHPNLSVLDGFSLACLYEQGQALVSVFYTADSLASAGDLDGDGLGDLLLVNGYPSGFLRAESGVEAR